MIIYTSPFTICFSQNNQQFLKYLTHQFKIQMKKLQNPTTYFFEQAQNTPDTFHDEISKFVNTLLDKDKCLLCKEQYHYENRIPRIMIHCGHTFCTPCLTRFYTNRRVRCPMCLKLVKHLETIERLPINHTIFEHLIKKQLQACKREGRIPAVRSAGQFLFGEFERVQKQAHLRQNPQKYDPDSGLAFCVFHPDRVEHFFCQSHKTFGCRVCIQVGHNKPECKITDLYTVEDAQIYHEMVRAQQIPTRLKEGVGNHLNFLDDEDLDGNLIDDDDSQQEHKSL